MKKLILLATCLLTMVVPTYAKSDSDTCELIAGMAAAPMRFYQDGLSYEEARAKSAQIVKNFEKFPKEKELIGHLIAFSLDYIYTEQKGKIKIGKTQKEKDEAVLNYATERYESCME